MTANDVVYKIIGSIGHLLVAIIFATIYPEKLIGAPDGVDIECRISEQAVQKIVDTAFPMDFEGVKKIETAPLGIKVTTEAAWKVRVEAPMISLLKDQQTFSAKVTGKASNFPTAGKVKGKIDLSYDQEKKAVVVRIIKAQYPVSAGPFAFTLDVTDDIPEFVIPLALPDIDLAIRDRTVRLSTEPRLEAVDGAIIVRSELGCSPVGRRQER